MFNWIDSVKYQYLKKHLTVCKQMINSKYNYSYGIEISESIN